MSEDPRLVLRATLRARRRALDAVTRMRAGEAIGAALRPWLHGHVAGYWAVDGEAPLLALRGGAGGFVYCLPLLQPGKQLRFAPWRPGDPLVQNRFGIPEPDLAQQSLRDPTELDVVLLPLIGFDRSGNRLGTGGGYYDRSFAFCRARPRPAGSPLLIGVGYACQEVDRVPVADWDVPLDLVATEHGMLDCRPS